MAPVDIVVMPPIVTNLKQGEFIIKKAQLESKSSSSSAPLITQTDATVLQTILNSRTPASTTLANQLQSLAASTAPTQNLLAVGTELNTSLSTADVIASLKASGIPVTAQNIATAVSGGPTPLQGLQNYADLMVQEFAKSGQTATVSMLLPTLTEWALPPPAGNGPFTQSQILSAAQAAVANAP